MSLQERLNTVFAELASFAVNEGQIRRFSDLQIVTHGYKENGYLFQSLVFKCPCVITNTTYKLEIATRSTTTVDFTNTLGIDLSYWCDFAELSVMERFAITERDWNSTIEMFSFFGMMQNKVRELCRQHRVIYMPVDNNKPEPDPKDNIWNSYPKPAGELFSTLANYLLGEDWYIADPVGVEQANEIVTYELLQKYSRKWRKEQKKKREDRK